MIAQVFIFGILNLRKARVYHGAEVTYKMVIIAMLMVPELLLGIEMDELSKLITVLLSMEDTMGNFHINFQVEE